MTQSNYTRSILNIKDVSINFYENCLETRIINGVETKIFRSFLTYIPTHCPLCGKENNSFNDFFSCFNSNYWNQLCLFKG